MIKNSFCYDIEVFPNFFSATFLKIDDEQFIKSFVVSWDLHIDEKEKLVSFLDNEVGLLVGYNSLFYDSPIMEFLYSYNGKNVNADIYAMSQSIITSNRDDHTPVRKEYLWQNLDLMKLMAFDKLGVSLKQCAINLRWHRIQDLPLPYDQLIKREDVEKIIEYNINDVLITNELYKAMQPQINLRKDLSSIYNVDLRNASDSKIANVLLEKFYSEFTNIDIKEVKYKRTKREFLWLRDCIAQGIKFKTKKLRNLKFETINTLVVGENNWAYKKEIEFGNCTYELGVGGLHSNDMPGKFVADDNYFLIDSDISSFYPHIIINNKIKPDHLNEDFVDILKLITKERLEAKKTGDKVKADGLKITINSIFGKLGSETFWLEDPRAMLTVTVSGQLYLLMLIERLTLEGIEVISANTDGIVCKVSRAMENKYKEVCEDWQKETNFELEYTYYDLYIRSDVNNYIARKTDGHTKEKGRYLRELDLKKGYHYPVVAQAMYNYFVNNKSLDESLCENRDIFDYCLSQKSGKDFRMEYRDGDKVEQLQKTNRYYISKTGGTLIKVNKKTGSEIGLSVGKLSKILNDYDANIPFEDYDVDFDFYKEEALKYICEIEDATYPTELIEEELADEIEEGIELDIDNLDMSAIVIRPPKFRYSESSYYFDKSTSTIYRGIGSLKYVTNSAAKEMKRIGNEYYPTFVDLLIKLEEECSVNARQMDTLIRLNFFEEFGKNKKLLDIYAEFTKGKNRYEKKQKDATKVKRKELLKEFEKTIPDKRINVLEQILWEKEELGYIQSAFDPDPKALDKEIYDQVKYEKEDNLKRRFVFANAVKDHEKYSPKIELHCLFTNKEMMMKVQKGTYENNPILGSDIVFCTNLEKKKAVKFIDGKFVESNELPPVWWISRYHVLSNEEIDKLI